jgi:hypothetical protein
VGTSAAPASHCRARRDVHQLLATAEVGKHPGLDRLVIADDDFVTRARIVLDGMATFHDERGIIDPVKGASNYMAAKQDRRDPKSGTEIR